MANLLLHNGRIYTPHHAQADALLVVDGQVGFAGPLAMARSLVSDAVEVDLGGRLVTPAFVDAHLHTIQTGQVLTGLDLAQTRSAADVLAAVTAFAKDHPQASLIAGQGWDETEWADPTPPTLQELDRAVPGRAVYLARVDVHSALVSTALLDQIPGIAAQAGFQATGWVTRDAHHACRAATDRLTSDHDRRAAARIALNRAAEHGIGSIHELGGPHLGPLEDLRRVSDVAAEVGIRAVTYWGELASDEAIERARSVGARGLAGDLCVDGAIGSRTAALHAPYADSDASGFLYLDRGDIAEHVVACTRAGLQAGFHCIGDDAVGTTIAGFRRAVDAVGPGALAERRHRLEHLEMIASTDLATLSRLGVVASMQPAFDQLWGGPGELYQRRLGSRSQTMNPLGSLHRAGVALAFGSDSPVTPLAGWATVRAAVQHHQPSERLTVATAFVAATRGGHWAAGEDRHGTLAVDSPADFAIWDITEDQLANGLPDFEQEKELPTCIATYVGGRAIFDRGDLG